MDDDVFKALHDVEIEKNRHPNVYCWYNALMKFSLEERSRYVRSTQLFLLLERSTNNNFIFRFPQPQHNSRTLTMNCVTSPRSTATSQTFNRTPIKDILPKANQYLLKASKLFTKD